MPPTALPEYRPEFLTVRHIAEKFVQVASDDQHTLVVFRPYFWAGQEGYRIGTVRDTVIADGMPTIADDPWFADPEAIMAAHPARFAEVGVVTMGLKSEVTFGFVAYAVIGPV